MCLYKVLEANRVNLWHTSFLGVLRGAQSKSSVCPAQKCPQMPQNRDLNKMCFCMFSYMGNPMSYSVLS